MFHGQGEYVLLNQGPPFYAMHSRRAEGAPITTITRPPGGPRRPSGGTVLEKRPSPASARRHHLHHDITSGGCSDPSHPKTDTLAHHGLISAILRLFLPDPPGAPIPKNEFLVTFSDHIARSLLVATEDCRSAR